MCYVGVPVEEEEVWRQSAKERGGEKSRREKEREEIITEADLPPLFVQGPSWDSSVDSKGPSKHDQPEFASSALLCMPKVGEDWG